MSEFKPIDLSAENLRMYWEGASNRFVRYLIYASRGFGRFNEISKYLQIVIGVVLTNKFVTFLGYKIEPTWIVIASLVGIPVIMAIGRWDLFKAQKATEFINQQKASITGYNSYNMQIKQLEILEEILKELKK